MIENIQVLSGECFLDILNEDSLISRRKLIVTEFSAKHKKNFLTNWWLLATFCCVWNSEESAMCVLSWKMKFTEETNGMLVLVDSTDHYSRLLSKRKHKLLEDIREGTLTYFGIPIFISVTYEEYSNSLKHKKWYWD